MQIIRMPTNAMRGGVGIGNPMLIKRLIVGVMCSLLALNGARSAQGQGVQSQPNSAENVSTQESSSTAQSGLVVINLFYNRLDFKALHRLIYTTTEYMRAGHRDFLLVINSSGGNLNAGIAAYNYLSSLPITLRTHNISNVSSAAVMIYCAGQTRTASPHSRFLIHNGTISLGSNKTIEEVEGSYELYQLQLQDAQNIFDRCLQPQEANVKQIFDAETVVGASDAKALGLVHSVQELPSDVSQSVITIPIGVDKWPQDYQ